MLSPEIQARADAEFARAMAGDQGGATDLITLLAGRVDQWPVLIVYKIDDTTFYHVTFEQMQGGWFRIAPSLHNYYIGWHNGPALRTSASPGQMTEAERNDLLTWFMQQVVTFPARLDEQLP